MSPPATARDGTTDLTIYKTSEVDGQPTGAWARGRVASTEVKLVYRWYSENRVDDYAQTLCAQVLANRDRGSALNVGFVYGIFALSPSKWERVRGRFSEFRSVVSRRIREVCDASGVPCAKPALETVIDPFDVTISGVTVPFGLDSQCSFRVEVTRHWLHALRRRSQRNRMTWQRMQRLANRWIPPARILHPYPWERFEARTRGKSRVR
jgi:hypothetical protein